MEDKSIFMTLNEYVEEFTKSGEKDFYAFMDNKKQEALNSGNNELANHIAEISEQAYREQLEYDEMMKADYEREQEEKRKREYEDFVDDPYYEEHGTILASMTPSETKNEDKIRQAYIDKILGKQKTVKEQKAILKELESQEVDLDN